MKKIVIVLWVFIWAVCGTLYFIHENCYPMYTEVVEIDIEKDVVVVEDFNGNLWEFYGAEDLEINDIIVCVMYTNLTNIVYDDVIVMTRYSGYIK